MTLVGTTLSIEPYNLSQIGTYIIEVKVEDDNSESDPDGVKSVIETFLITVSYVNNPCVLDTSGITTSGFSFELGEDQQIELPSDFTDIDTTDSHRWEFYSEAGTNLSWISAPSFVFSPGSVFNSRRLQRRGMVNQVFMTLDLTSGSLEEKIAYSTPWIIQARLYDDDSNGSGAEQFCFIEYEVEIYPRIYFKSEFED